MAIRPPPIAATRLQNVAVEAIIPATDRIAAWAKHQFAAEALRLVLEAATSANIDVLPVKGVVLAHSLYDSVEERPMLDVDLRVRPGDLGGLARVARRRGWEVRRPSRQLGALEFRVSRTLIEVETSIGPPGMCAVSVDDMLGRSRLCTGPLGFSHREPELHDHALLLCVNVFKDKLVLAPRWAREDLLRIARAKAFSTERFLRRVAAAKLRTLVWIVADWLASDPAGRPWEDVRDATAPPRRAYTAVYRTLGRHAPTNPALAFVARAASDNVLSRLNAVFLMVVGTFRAGRSPS